MHWVLHNPMADLPGPNFLVVYAVVVLIAVIYVRVRMRRLDPTVEIEPCDVPGKLGHLEIAYLGGNAMKVLGVLLFDLHRRGYLTLIEYKKGKFHIARGRHYPDEARLTRLERAVFDRIKIPIDASLLRADKELMAPVEEYCEELDEALREEQLLMPAECRSRANVYAGEAIAWLLLLSTYKIVVGVAKGHTNVGLLIALALIGVVVVVIASRLPRVSRRGAELLRKSRLAFQDQQDQLVISQDPASCPHAAMTAALFGFTAMAGTPWVSAWKQLAPRAKDGGSGCGGAGCGGAGCGGGCGGGGCGGCGG